MADKTSWTKPPFCHRYGDSRAGVGGAEDASGLSAPPPPEGGAVGGRPSGGPRSGAEASGRGPARARSRRVHDWDASRGRGRRDEDLGDAQPDLLADGTAFDVDPGQPEH